jgi:hypothetical protein
VDPHLQRLPEDPTVRRLHERFSNAVREVGIALEELKHPPAAGVSGCVDQGVDHRPGVGDLQEGGEAFAVRGLRPALPVGDNHAMASPEDVHQAALLRAEQAAAAKALKAERRAENERNREAKLAARAEAERRAALPIHERLAATAAKIDAK